MSKLMRLFTHKNSNRYISDLQNIIQNYNNTTHRSTGLKPNEINKENWFLAFRALYKDLLKSKEAPIPKFSLNQIVRISLVKQVFEKG